MQFFKRWIIVFVGFAASSTFALADTKFIRVRLSQSQKTIHISGFDLRANGEAVSGSNLPVRSSLTVDLASDGWRFGAKAAGLGRGLLKVSGEMMKVNDQAWPGELVLQASGAGHFDLIARVDLDDYLRGVLPSEMPVGWPLAALRAQAVASRSYVLAEAQARVGDGFDVDNTVQSQVFNWQKYSRATLAVREKIDRVLNETRGDILVGKTGEPYLAYFHSDCGGVTEDAHNVWGGTSVGGSASAGASASASAATAPGANIVHDSHCALNLSSHWSKVISISEIQLAAQDFFQDPALNKITDVRIATFAPSGRAQDVALIMDDSSEKHLNSQDFRQMMGYSRLRSTLFSLEHTDSGDLRFTGRGYGHGVGLCQQGARFMAGAGAGYREILRRYYPQTRLSSRLSAGAVAAQHRQSL